MDIEALIEGLGRPAAYPWHGPDASVEVIQTHISVVFLVGREVFKIHKPVDFGFLDRWWVLEKKLENFDVNPEEWDEEGRPRDPQSQMKAGVVF